jgi:hypothetical protein
LDKEREEEKRKREEGGERREMYFNPMRNAARSSLFTPPSISNSLQIGFICLIIST